MPVTPLVSRRLVSPDVASLVAKGSRLGSPPPIASSRVPIVGTSRKAKVTRAAIPTVALGLRRRIVTPPPKTSPSCSGRSGTTPGWYTGGPNGGW